MTLTRGDFETLEIEANTGASAEMHQATTANQLYLDLDTGSTFFGGQQLRVETARVELSTGSTANVYRAKTVTGKVSTGVMFESTKQPRWRWKNLSPAVPCVVAVAELSA